MTKFLEVRVDDQAPVYVRDGLPERRIVDRYVSMTAVYQTVTAKPVDRIPQGATRLDSENRTGGKRYR